MKKNATLNTKLLNAMLVSAGVLAAVSISAKADSITPSLTVPGAVGAVSAPATGTVVYSNVKNSAGTVIGNFTYDIATATWAGPAGWTPIAGAANTLVKNAGTSTQETVVFTPTGAPAISASGPATLVTPVVSPTYNNTATVSSVLGASTANGALAVTGTGQLPVAAAPAALPYAYSNANTTLNNAGSAAAAPVTSPVVGTTVPVASGTVTVNGAGVPVNLGTYTVTFNGQSTTGAIAGNAANLTAAGLNINGLTGVGTVNADGTINATPVADPLKSTSLTANGLTTTGAVNSATLTTTGAATVGSNLSVGGTLKVTGATTTAGITNTGNIGTTTLSTTGNATIGGNAAIAGNTSIAGNASIAGALTVANITDGAGNRVAFSTGAATVTGGGTALQLNSNGASFANGAGAPVRVTGVADGVNQFDAVNYSQLQAARTAASRGTATAAALAGLPQVEPGKTFAIGVGVGNYDGESGFALGGSFRINDRALIKIGAATSGNGGKAAVNGGFGYSW